MTGAGDVEQSTSVNEFARGWAVLLAAFVGQKRWLALNFKQKAHEGFYRGMSDVCALHFGNLNMKAKMRGGETRL